MQGSVSVSPLGKVAGTGCSDRPGAGVPIHSAAPFPQNPNPIRLPDKESGRGRYRSTRRGNQWRWRPLLARAALLEQATGKACRSRGVPGIVSGRGFARACIVGAVGGCQSSWAVASRSAGGLLSAAGGGLDPAARFYRGEGALDRILELQEEAIKSAMRYVTLAGRAGQHYVDALRLLNAIEEARRRAEAVVAGMEFVPVPAWEFLMDSTSEEAFNDEQLVTRVRISRAFELGGFEREQAVEDGALEPGGDGGFGAGVEAAVEGGDEQVGADGGAWAALGDVAVDVVGATEVDLADDFGLAVDALGLAGVVVGVAADDLLDETGHELSHTLAQI